jgi:glutathione S-transferase
MAIIAEDNMVKAAKFDAYWNDKIKDKNVENLEDKLAVVKDKIETQRFSEACHGPPCKFGTFFDMVHSNNAARCRLWIKTKGLQNKIKTIVVRYADLKGEDFRSVNPLMKVPAFITPDGVTIFESFVIMQYLEDAYGHEGIPTMLTDPTERAFVHLVVRCHDLYIASPNSTQPGFSHTQGCMYLPSEPNAQVSIDRCMDIKTRAAKLAELNKQLNFFEDNCKFAPYLCGSQMTHADMTVFPSTVFMEFMLPRVFGWSPAFTAEDT